MCCVREVLCVISEYTKSILYWSDLRSYVYTGWFFRDTDHFEVLSISVRIMKCSG